MAAEAGPCLSLAGQGRGLPAGGGAPGQVAARGLWTPLCPCSGRRCGVTPATLAELAGLSPSLVETPGVTAPEDGPPGILEDWPSSLSGPAGKLTSAVEASLEHLTSRTWWIPADRATLTVRLDRELARGCSSVRIPWPVLPVRVCLKLH